MANVSSEHIVLNENGVARIAGSRIKVNQIVLAKRIHGWSPEQIQSEYPHLSLAEIHAAFAYYYDHQADMDAEIERDLAAADELRGAAPPSQVAEKLRALGKLA